MIELPVITIFSPKYCREEEIARKIAEKLNCGRIGADVLKAASTRFGTTVDGLERTMRGHSSVFGSFTREKERNIVYIKAAVAQALMGDDLVYLGMASHLIPRTIGHVLRVCLTATKDYRCSTAVESGDFKSEKDARKAVKKDEMELAHWTNELFKKSPWDKSLYDIKIPVDKCTPEEAAAVVCENAARDVVRSSPDSRRAAEDFRLASEAHIELIKQGHFDTDVACDDGNITIFINKHVLRLEPLQKELEKIASQVQGVKKVHAKAGPDFYKADIYRRQTFELPQKVLLVDDETEFVQTLSERLQIREFGTAVAYNGEEAISMVKEEEPEVMVLDLRMPGIGGLDVLKKLKEEHPDVKVIILTGHGTEKDRELAMSLGAFAYLEKPVDIEMLSITMKEAYEKARREKSNDGKK
ncbi:MAG: response regulator [bacterium]